MLRVWGGGIYEKDIFYDLCDKNGIMVWQDFMFANAMCPGTTEFLTSVRDEVIQNIVRLRRHASIVLWCGNNEIDEGWFNWGWPEQYGYSAKDSTFIYKTYRTVFNEIIPNSLRKHDTLRPYIPTSPKYSWGKGSSLTEGDLHYWGVWWGKEPFDAYTTHVGRFVSEYGFQGFPDIPTIEKISRPVDRVLGSSVMKAHQKHPVGYETIEEYMKRYYHVPAEFEKYIYVSQLLQAEGMKTAIEAHRRAKPYCMGTLYWQLNDTWPVVSWSTRDYFGAPKASHYYVKKLYSEFLVSPVMEEGIRLKIYGMFDEPDSQKAIFRAVLADFSGKVLWEEKKEVNFPPDRALIITDTNLAPVLSGVDPATVFIYTEAKNILGVRSSNILYMVPPKDLKLEKPEIEVTTEEIKEGYMLILYSRTLAKNVYLSVPMKGEFTDNYFDLLPHEQKKILFHTLERAEDFREKLKIITLTDTY
jgi:beta-mannosidase